MCMQKINLITQLFLKMLQTNSKLVILDNLCMPGYTHLKCNLAIWRNLWGSFVGKISSSFSRFPWDITKICKLILGTLGMTGYANPKWYYQLVETFRVHLQAKNQVHPPNLFWRYCKDIETSYFGYFGHAWLNTHKIHKMIVSTCRRLRCLSAC